MFRTAGLIGVGLIGGSLGLAMKSGDLVERVIGFGRTQKNLDQAKQIGAIDEVVELATLCSQSDLIILSVPVAQTQAMLEQILPHLREQTVVIDVGSTKSDVIASAKAALGERVNQFVACHPIAGGAQHGALAARKDLFVDRQVMICPIPENRPDFISVIEEFWHRLGSLIFKMSALEHDHIFATVSHLPHELSYALMLQVANADDADKKFTHAGAGFRDFTRIAASSPEMWCDITLANRTAILQELDTYLQIVSHLKESIVAEDRVTLEQLFTLASISRNRWQA